MIQLVVSFRHCEVFRSLNNVVYHIWISSVTAINIFKICYAKRTSLSKRTGNDRQFDWSFIQRSDKKVNITFHCSNRGSLYLEIGHIRNKTIFNIENIEYLKSLQG